MLLGKYKISPRVLRVGAKQTISVEGLDEVTKIYDDVDYEISVTRTDGWKYKEGINFLQRGRDLTSTQICRAENGVLSFTYDFDYECEYEIKVARTEGDTHFPERQEKFWSGKKSRATRGFTFRVYAVCDDLYEKRPYKCDLHIHTDESDGNESPKLVGATYRQYGYDAICITDHYTMLGSKMAIEAFEDIDAGLKIFQGEEVHPFYGSIVHVVNFNGKTSVNDLYYSDTKKAEKEIEALADGFDFPDEVDRKELAYFKWCFDKIRESGGIAIYPHSLWSVFGAYNVRTEISEYIIKNKMCDAYEIFGGMSKRDNRLSVELLAEMKRNGIDLPIIASSDAHSIAGHGSAHFDDTFSIVFAKDKEQIPNAVLEGNTIVVENFDTSDKIAHGNFRLVRYAYFLLDQYFGEHDLLCNALGTALIGLDPGDSGQKEMVAKLKKIVTDYENEFFGNNRI